MNARIVSVALTALLVAAAGCSESAPAPEREEAPFARPSGYWEGEGTWHKVDMKDAYKEMTRSADFTFWFVLDRDGSVDGEIEIQYDAQLTVDGLPEINMPLPGGIGVGFAPKVGGRVTDPDPKRKYPLSGSYNDGTLAIAAIIDENAKPIEFTFRADPGVTAGVKVARSYQGGAAANSEIGVGTNAPPMQITVKKMPMTPFSPFVAPGSVTKRPLGPHVVAFELHEEELNVEWDARQITTEETRR